MEAHDFKHVRGFSVLEIVMVIVLIGVLAGFSLAPMKDYLNRLQFEQSVDGIKRLILLAKSKAAANPRVHCGVYFDLNQDTQQVIGFQDVVNPQDYEYDRAGDEPYQNPIQLKRGVRISLVPGYTNTIIFRGDGSAYESGKLIISYAHLQDTVSILASTGNVRVSR